MTKSRAERMPGGVEIERNRLKPGNLATLRESIEGERRSRRSGRQKKGTDPMWMHPTILASLGNTAWLSTLGSLIGVSGIPEIRMDGYY
jgi:hypothetical protein